MRRKLIFLLFCISAFILSACGSRSYEDGYADGYDAGYQAAAKLYQSSNSPTISSEKSEDHITEPKNGYVFQEIPDCDYLAPLSIETVGSSGYYFVLDPIALYSPSEFISSEYAKIIAMNSYIRLYIHGGSSIDIDVPLGEYEIFYATGDSWLGEDELFGPDTRYYKCDDTFLFEETQSGYNGWTVSLAPVANGNLDTELIDSDSFPK